MSREYSRMTWVSIFSVRLLVTGRLVRISHENEYFILLAFSISMFGSGFWAFGILAVETRLFSRIMISWLVSAIRKKISGNMSSAMIAPDLISFSPWSFAFFGDYDRERCRIGISACLFSSKPQGFLAECRLDMIHREFLFGGLQNPSKDVECWYESHQGHGNDEFLG